jgi:hypothetical protein
MQCASARPRRLPPWESRTSALASTRAERHARWPAGAAAARVHRCSKTSTRPWRRIAFACVFRPRALPRLLQIDVSTSTAMDRSNIPDQRKTVAGTAVVSIDRRLSIEDGRRRYSGSGAEEHRASAFSPGIAPARDFAPTPIASDTSCRGHCLSPSPELTRETGEAAGAAHASKACAARGPCDAGSPRREPALTNPRAFRREAVRERGLTFRLA